MKPGLAAVEDWIERNRDGAIKLSPTADLEVLPRGEVEIIQRGRGLVQAILSVGTLASTDRELGNRDPATSRRATRIDDGASFVVDADRRLPELPEIAPEQEWLHVVEPAIERAGLLGTLARSLDLTTPHEHAGFLSGAEAALSPWLRPARLHVKLPGRIETVARWFGKRPVGHVTIRVRGGRIRDHGRERCGGREQNAIRST